MTSFSDMPDEEAELTSDRKRFLPQLLLLGVVVIGLIIVWTGGAYRPSGKRAKLVKCQSNLRGLYLSLLEYAMDNNDHFPPKGKTLPTLTKMLKETEWLILIICPSKPTDFELDPDNFTDEDIIEFSGYEETQDQVDGRTPVGKPIIWDRKGNHEDQRNVLCFDGNIEYITEEKFQKLIEQYEGK